MPRIKQLLVRVGDSNILDTAQPLQNSGVSSQVTFRKPSELTNNYLRKLLLESKHIPTSIDPVRLGFAAPVKNK